MTLRSPFLMRSGFLAFRLILSILGLIVMAALLGGGTAYADGVAIDGALAGCGGASGGVAFDSELVTANASTVEPGGAVSGSANLPTGSLSVSETSSQGCSGFISADLSIAGEVFLPAGVPEANIMLIDTSFTESNNCAVVGCGNVGGEPLAQIFLSGLFENLANGVSEAFSCGPSFSGNTLTGCVFSPVAVLGVRGDPILIQAFLEVSVANGASVSASDPLELVLPPGATFVPDNSSLSFPTVTETATPEPSSLLLLGTGLLGLGPLLRRRFARC